MGDMLASFARRRRLPRLPMTLDTVFARIVRRDRSRSEATLQADIRQLMLTAPLGLEERNIVDADLETPVGTRRRIDIEAGSCLIEVKRDLSAGSALADAIEQIGDYLRHRQRDTGTRYVGIVTDGADWRCVRLSGEGIEGLPQEVTAFKVSGAKADPEGLLIWLEGVLATARDIPATPKEIARRLGAGSSAHQLDRETLLDLFNRHRDHEAVKMKRRLWARLLTTALGTQFQDSDELFVEHTYLVNTAEIIAHAVVRFDLETIAPRSLLSGSKFEESGILGVVEADFFDWVAHVPGGDVFVRSLARRVGRFDWQNVGGDVLKVLYESVITPDTRKRLGEYYTPDWLAEHIVETAVDRPLEQRVLDPSCGSGTFVFQAVRRYLAAADAAGMKLDETLSGLVDRVMGMDLHPVAVTLARVTYLLAIGTDRLIDPNRGTIQVPIFLGDAIQWRREASDLFSGGHLVIEADDKKELFETELRFPEALLKNPSRFNQVVEAMASAASNRKANSSPPSLAALYQRHAIGTEDRPTLDATFRTLCDLHDQGRDHIWSYYVRNLARPVWMAQPDNRVDILVGNPPWLAYRFMTEAMQQTFREYSEERGLWHGAKVATHQDLSGLFLVRAVELYLRQGGKFAFVVPNGAVDRGQYAGLRSGSYARPKSKEPVNVAFSEPWDLRRIRPHIFPRGSAVLFGTRAKKSVPLPGELTVWSGKVPKSGAPWREVSPTLNQSPGIAQLISGDPTSPWAERFRQGASIVPRLFFFVQRKAAGPVGMAAGKVSVRSQRGANDKAPWSKLPDLEGVVESEFLRPVLLGRHVLSYRVLPHAEAVIPRDSEGLMASDGDRLDLYPGLAAWYRQADALWNAHRSSERLSLLQQLDYRHKLSQQFPLQPERIVYTASGMHLAAARVSNARAVIDYSLYWATAQSADEARFLCAILNAAATTELVRPLMSYGKDERHFDKHIWQLPIPAFDPSDELHVKLATRSGELEAQVAELAVDEKKHFSAGRRRIREFIAQSVSGQEIEELVEELLA